MLNHGGQRGQMGRARTRRAGHQKSFHIEDDASLGVCAASGRAELPWARARGRAGARQAGRCSRRLEQVRWLASWADRATGFVVSGFATPPACRAFYKPWAPVAWYASLAQRRGAQERADGYGFKEALVATCSGFSLLSASLFSHGFVGCLQILAAHLFRARLMRAQR